MQRLWTGRFECPDCEIEYEAAADPESELVCEECCEPLIPVDKDEPEGQGEEEGSLTLPSLMHSKG